MIKQVILPTRALMEVWEPVFRHAVEQEGISMASLGHFVVWTVSQGEGIDGSPMAFEEFSMALAEYLHESGYNPQAPERSNYECLQDLMEEAWSNLTRALYAIYAAIFNYRELLANYGEGRLYVSGLNFHSWHGRDLVVAVQVSPTRGGWSYNGIPQARAGMA